MGATIFTSYVNNNRGFIVNPELVSSSTVTVYETPVANQISIWKSDSSIQGSSNLTYAGGTLTISGTVAATTITGANVTTGADPGHTHTTITVADESADTICFPLFVTAAAGTLQPKTGSNLEFNSSTGELTTIGDISVEKDNGDINVGSGTGTGRFNAISATGSVAGLTLTSGASTVEMAYVETSGYCFFNTAATETAIKFYDNGAVELYWDNAKKLETTAAGTTITGALTATTLIGTTLTGTLSTAAQTNVTSVGTLTSLIVAGTINTSTLEPASGNLTINAENHVYIKVNDGGPAIDALDSGAVTLYWNELPRLATSATGATVTGTLTATTLAGTLSTAAQTNVTSVGSLTSLTVAGTVYTSTLEPASGNLTINAENHVYIKVNDGGPAIDALDSGAVTLYWNELPRLATSDDGVDITGTIKATTMKSGANEGAAGANVGELWADTSAANVVKLRTV